MVTSGCITLFDINPCGNCLTDFQTSFFNFDFVNDQPLCGRKSIGDNSVRALTNEHACISNLSAALGVERRVIQNDFALLALVQRLNFVVAFEQRDDF
jgi:hypothetical protein